MRQSVEILCLCFWIDQREVQVSTVSHLIKNSSMESHLKSRVHFKDMFLKSCFSIVDIVWVYCWIIFDLFDYFHS